MKYSIEGELAQTAKLTLEKGETCWAAKGSLMALDPGIQWTLKIPGGVEGAARRILSGEGVTLTFIEATRESQTVMLSSNQPGKIIDWDLSQGPVVTTRGSFVAAFGPSVQIDVTVAKRAGAAFFGGTGLFLQRISGRGRVFIHGAGDFVDQTLESGETVLVSTGNLAAFSDEIDYGIQSVAGCRRILFGGEGLFMAKLRGPGRFLLQSLKRGNARKGGGRAG